MIDVLRVWSLEHWPVTFAAFSVLFLGAGVFAISEIAKRDPKAVYGTFYLACLSIASTSLVLSYAQGSGLFRIDQKPTTAFGVLLVHGIEIALNVKDDVWIATSAIILGVLPQIAAYILAAPFGAAGSTRFLGALADFAFFTVYKGIVVAGSVLGTVSVALVRSNASNFREARGLLLVAILSFPVAAYMYMLRCQWLEAIDPHGRVQPTRARTLVRQLHSLATRRVRNQVAD